MAPTPNWTLRFFTPKMAPNPVVAREIPEGTIAKT